MKVLFAISEAYPFVKSGGLGDVGGSFPIALQNEGIEIRVIMPKYSAIAEKYLQLMELVASFQVELAWRKLHCTISKLELQGVVYYFLENDYYFARERLYGYDDDGELFAFFCRAVLESVPYLEYQPDILHCNDWHTALIPLLLKDSYSQKHYYSKMKSILTIHNLNYQGWAPLSYFEDVLGLGGQQRAWECLEYYGSLNYLKGGILEADLITTVSPTYAQEIQYPFYGENLDSFLRQRGEDLFGVLNGIDTDKYNPQVDPNIYVNYRNSLIKKGTNKRGLQEFLGLPAQRDIPLIAMVSRLVEQKGLDLVIFILEGLLSMNVQLVILGTGQRRYEEALQQLADKYPDKLIVKLLYDEALAHKIYSGSDLLLMPSLFEPCGLAQLIAMRYGTLPIVRETGGLKDTVIPYNQFTGEGNGFSFANYNAHELLFAIERAVELFNNDKTTWKALVKNALKGDYGWEKSAVQYHSLYKRVLTR